MINFRNVIAAVVLGLAVAAAASPALAKERARTNTGQDARAQSQPIGSEFRDGQMTSNREQGAPGMQYQGQPLSAAHLGRQPAVQIYRSCMMEHGEIE